MHLDRLAALFVLLAATGRAAIVSSALLGYRHEPGVESKMLAAVQAEVSAARFLKADAGLSFSLFQHNGLGEAGLGLGAALFRPAGLTLTLGVQHQQWNDWQAGENRVLATLEAGPVYGFDAGLGLVRRVPVFGSGYGSPLAWSGGAAEWNLLYRLRWRFLQQEGWWLRAGFSTYDRLTAHSPQQFPFEVDGAYRVRDNLEVVAGAGTAVVGYSGGLISLHEVEVTVGVKHAL